MILKKVPSLPSLRSAAEEGELSVSRGGLCHHLAYDDRGTPPHPQNQSCLPPLHQTTPHTHTKQHENKTRPKSPWSQQRTNVCQIEARNSCQNRDPPLHEAPRSSFYGLVLLDLLTCSHPHPPPTTTPHTACTLGGVGRVWGQREGGPGKDKRRSVDHSQHFGTRRKKKKSWTARH